MSGARCQEQRCGERVCWLDLCPGSGQGRGGSSLVAAGPSMQLCPTPHHHGPPIGDSFALASHRGWLRVVLDFTHTPSSSWLQAILGVREWMLPEDYLELRNQQKNAPFRNADSTGHSNITFSAPRETSFCGKDLGKDDPLALPSSLCMWPDSVPSPRAGQVGLA